MSNDPASVPTPSAPPLKRRREDVLTDEQTQLIDSISTPDGLSNILAEDYYGYSWKRFYSSITKDR